MALRRSFGILPWQFSQDPNEPSLMRSSASFISFSSSVWLPIRPKVKVFSEASLANSAMWPGTLDWSPDRSAPLPLVSPRRPSRSPSSKALRSWRSVRNSCSSLFFMLLRIMHHPQKGIQGFLGTNPRSDPPLERSGARGAIAGAYLEIGGEEELLGHRASILFLPKRAAAAFGPDALLRQDLDQLLPVAADGSWRVDPDLPGERNTAFLRLGDPLGEGLDQIPSELPFVGIGSLFQAVHALPELVHLHEDRFGVENYHSIAPLSLPILSTSHGQR